MPCFLTRRAGPVLRDNPQPLYFTLAIVDVEIDVSVVVNSDVAPSFDAARLAKSLPLRKSARPLAEPLSLYETGRLRRLSSKPRHSPRQ